MRQFGIKMKKQELCETDDWNKFFPWRENPPRFTSERWKWKYCCKGPEPMDWEDLPEVRVSKKKKDSEIIDIEVYANVQVEAIPPAPKKASPPLEPNTSLSFQEKETFPTPKKASPPSTEIVLRKIRSHTRLKVRTPTVSPENRVIFKRVDLFFTKIGSFEVYKFTIKIVIRSSHLKFQSCNNNLSVIQFIFSGGE
ncbi:hypothetical protein TNIN_110301 [Trichonephila inaurata madagascariensis]|uniref:Uncharacterized protein n=1 Tax=Trichonephila inaurata madagascariensis TaxID=2747483 RepID=A0A8X6XES3_9ARAC|nr:hypothetical protein TNIN_110301 [Trichonephila inaurata madagascariensis]